MDAWIRLDLHVVILGATDPGILTLIKWLAGDVNSRDTPAQKTALQILEERYARGEIEREAFEQKKSDLSR